MGGDQARPKVRGENVAARARRGAESVEMVVVVGGGSGSGNDDDDDEREIAKKPLITAMTCYHFLVCFVGCQDLLEC